MATRTGTSSKTREPLTKDRVLRAAVALADQVGVESLSMRNLAHQLGVVPMALYKHVANKEEMLDGMVDVVVGEIDLGLTGLDWKTAVRERILSARRALLRHPWASRVIESRSDPTPAVLQYMDEMVGLFISGGMSVELTHHALHALGSRMFGFSQELYDDTPDVDLQVADDVLAQIAQAYPYLGEIARSITHDQESVVGLGCDDQFEFEFTLDLLLDGLDRLNKQA